MEDQHGLIERCLVIVIAALAEISISQGAFQTINHSFNSRPFFHQCLKSLGHRRIFCRDGRKFVERNDNMANFGVVGMATLGLELARTADVFLTFINGGAIIVPGILSDTAIDHLVFCLTIKSAPCRE